MLEIKNVEIYDLEYSIVSCRNAMRTDMVNPIGFNFGIPVFPEKEFEDSLKRAISLAKSPSNSGHPNFLTGIRVSFDIKYPNYISPELQRYHFFDIVTSSSKMHKLASIVASDSFNKYVDEETIAKTKKYAEAFNQDPSYENRMKLLSNCPQGIELFMRVSTNYMQLRNMYHQRKNHRIKEDWGAFCSMVQELPYFNVFINPEK